VLGIIQFVNALLERAELGLQPAVLDVLEGAGFLEFLDFVFRNVETRFVDLEIHANDFTVFFGEGEEVLDGAT
jgi:hypothetical protein